MNDNTYAGSSLVVTWIQAAATTVITGDHKTCTWTPDINLIDKTAGAATHKSFIPNVKSGVVTFNANMQGGTYSGGTTTFSTLSRGNVGTLQIQPEGTASSKPKIAIPAISQGVAYSWPYNDVVEVTVNWQQNGAEVESAN